MVIVVVVFIEIVTDETVIKMVVTHLFDVSVHCYYL